MIWAMLLLFVMMINEFRHTSWFSLDPDYWRLVQPGFEPVRLLRCLFSSVQLVQPGSYFGNLVQVLVRYLPPSWFSYDPGFGTWFRFWSGIFRLAGSARIQGWEPGSGSEQVSILSTAGLAGIQKGRKQSRDCRVGTKQSGDCWVRTCSCTLRAISRCTSRCTSRLSTAGFAGIQRVANNQETVCFTCA